MTPPRIEPMLASPWPAPFSDDEWWFEPKWDGIRGIVAWDAPRIRIVTRRGNEVASRYPELDALSGVPPAVIDGEVIAFDDGGSPSFQRLQQRGAPSGGGPPVAFVAFDLLWLDGTSLIDRPIEERIERLGSLDLGPPYQRVDPTPGDGLGLWRGIVERDLEGMVAKRAGSAYRPGARSPDWRKIHHRHAVRALVGGFTAGEGGRSRTFGSLLLGLRDGGRLRWIGSVGTGFSDRALGAIRRALDEMRVDVSPFLPDPELPAAAWVEPSLVAAVEYRNWTDAGRLRHPVFKGFTDEGPEAITWASEGPG